MVFLFFPIFLSFFFLCPVHPAEGKGYGVEVRLTSPRIFETEPGKIVTGSFLVSNNTGHEEEFLDELELPEGWQAITLHPVPFKLKHRGQEVRLAAFLVPINCPAGNYKITFSIKSRRDYGITDSDDFSVAVLPVMRLEMSLEDKIDAVVAGDVYKIRLRALNRGNYDVTIKPDVRSDPDYPVKTEPYNINLESGKSALFNIEVKTDGSLRQRITQILTIKLDAGGFKNGTIPEEQTVTVDIIPRVSGEFDPYHRLPSRLSLIAVNEDGKDGYQLEFSGSGDLDEEGKRKIDFLIRGPDIQDKSIFGQRDEYRLSYYDRFTDLHFGDRSYSLSPLTERNRYGRGLEGDFHTKAFEIGAFYLKTLWESPEKREIGTYLKYQVNNHLDIKGNFLNRDTDPEPFIKGFSYKIYSIQAEAKLDKLINLDMEYSLSDGGREGKGSENAYRIDLEGEVFNSVQYSLEKIYAGARYFGYYNDNDYIRGAITFPVYKKLRGNFAYHAFKDNLESDPFRAVSTEERYYKTGIEYPFSSGANASFDYEDFQKEDYLAPADFNFKEKRFILGLGHTFRIFNIQAYMEGGELEDRISYARHALERYSLYANFYPNSRQSYGLYTIVGNDKFTGSPERTKNGGVSFNWHIRENIQFQMYYQKNNFDSIKKPEQNYLLSSLKYTLPNAHSFNLSYRNFWIEDRGDTSLFLVYTIPLNIPVSRKRSIGAIKGRVYDREKAERAPIQDVILTAGDATAVTDREGRFIFPSIKPGMHYLSVAKNSIGLNRVIGEALPMEVEVKGGEAAEVEIGVVTSCRIYGRITRFITKQGIDYKTDFEEDDNFKEAGGADNVLVEVTNGRERLRRITDEKGRFSFEDIAPDRWTLRVYEYNLPANSYLEKDSFSIELSAGEEKEINIKVLPRLRAIQIIEEGYIK